MTATFSRVALWGAGLWALSFTLVWDATRAADNNSDVVARLGKTEFTAASFGDFLRSLDPALRKKALADPELMNRLVGLELGRMALLNEAKAKKWEQRPEVARQLERAKDQALVAVYLNSVAALPKDYPSDAEIKSAYDQNRDSFMTPRQYRLEQIFVRLPTGGDKPAIEAARSKAAELARKARAPGADFEDIARTSSDHKPSAEKGGDLGWAGQEQLVPEIRTQVTGMLKGEISDPILGSTGWHIVRLMDTKAAATRPIAEVRDSLVANLRQRKAQELQQAYVASLLEKNPVSVNEARVRTLFESAPAE